LASKDGKACTNSILSVTIGELSSVILPLVSSHGSGTNLVGVILWEEEIQICTKEVVFFCRGASRRTLKMEIYTALVGFMSHNLQLSVECFVDHCLSF
jgi:hypothetical protein